MAGRGRPRKDALSRAAAEAKSQGQSYGHFMEAQQKKEVHVEQTDGVERQRVSDRIQAQKMSARAYGHHMAALKEIQDEISEHDKSIDEERLNVCDHHLTFPTDESGSIDYTGLYDTSSLRNIIEEHYA